MKSLKTECHELAEHIMRFPAKTDEMRWLKAELSKMLLDKTNIRELTYDYQEEQEIQNPYLAELTHQYERN
ncbi:hypothetical protein SCRES1_gp38 [Synechococcus phage S-CRES1]|nr:hypothetical protein SCRES1_gp38 [Synechococcus phage S-CRES1]